VYWRIEAWPLGEDEPVAIGPGRVRWVEAHDAAEQHVTEGASAMAVPWWPDEAASGASMAIPRMRSMAC
jgi:hypothetical protein